MTEDISRQAFLGANSDATFASSKVGIIGFSGGGSHVGQQLAHVGVLDYVVVDPKKMAGKHLHRLVGATANDIEKGTAKAKIAERLIKGIRPKANVKGLVGTWQDNQIFLRDRNAIVGCVDSYSEREQLERFCRRFLIPYIDVGMNVFAIDGSHHIAGQTVLSSPGHPCLRCMGIITEDKLAEEAEKYGAAGPDAQVIWPNGVLASTAVGLFVQLVSPWHKFSSASAYLEYNGNKPTLVSSPRMEFAITTPCPHYGSMDVGDPMFELDTDSGQK